jgi:predicted PurR-regulated permease PerM
VARGRRHAGRGRCRFLSLTQPIVAPVITAAVVAAVTSPLVAWLERCGVALGVGAALLLVGVLGWPGP